MGIKREILIIVFILTFIWGSIIGHCIVMNTPTSYKTICVDFKFTKDGKYYIVGEVTSGQQMGETDVYLVEQDSYNRLTEGMEYSISTKGSNKWKKFNKRVYDFKRKIY